MMSDHVVIIGGGLSGTLQAISLLRQPDRQVTLIERSARLARGLAYGTTQSCHLLNVRAKNLSAHIDAPGDFIRWVEERKLGRAEDFLPRQTYGAYLAEQLETAAAAAGDRFRIIRGEAVNVEPRGGQVRVALDDGRSVTGGALVLALGNFAPDVPPGIDPVALGAAYANDPWSGAVTEGLDPDRDILLLGTGMTMVDVALQLVESGFKGQIVALSRRGLLPLPHPTTVLPHGSCETPPQTTEVSALLREARRMADGNEWSGVIDPLRPHVQRLWQSANDAQRARFLRHLRPWWDIHRHRLSPAAYHRIAALRCNGQLEIHAGKLRACEATPEGVRLHWRPRGQEALAQRDFQKIINCTGTGCNVETARQPVLDDLLRQKLARPGPCRMGLAVTSRSALIGADGTASPNMFALGPLTRGAFWEITAVPEIRQQAWDIALELGRRSGTAERAALRASA